MTQSGHAAADRPRETLWKTLQTFSATRIVIAIMLLAYLSLNTKKGSWVSEGFLYQEVCVLYLLLSVAFFVVATVRQRRLLLQTAMQVAIDIAAISALYVGAGGMRSGLAILFLFPLAGSAIIVPLVPALFFVSAVAIVLLIEGGYQWLATLDDTSISQSGLYGAAFFAAVLSINRLAARLINQEQLTDRQARDLRLQEAINRLIIKDMGDGIIVTDRKGVILTANPAADMMLGLPIVGDEKRHSLGNVTGLAPIAEAFVAWRNRAGPHASEELADAPVFVTVKPARLTLDTVTPRLGRRDIAVHLRVRFAPVAATGLEPGTTVIFLQDVSEIENQAQQLKLASMGRLTASIAHEVRNPLSAISHATGLLREESAGGAPGRLLEIVEDNIERLNRMVEDILKLSRKAQLQSDPIDLRSVLTDVVEEFCATHSAGKSMIHLAESPAYRVWFDPMHLREVVVNLLSNALRYASGAPHSIRIFILPAALDRLELHVQDDGPPMAPEVRAHLFEPFYTTSSRGTGLGLYLARELCLNNGAMLDYEYRLDPSEALPAEAGGRFVVTFAKSALA